MKRMSGLVLFSALLGLAGCEDTTRSGTSPANAAPQEQTWGQARREFFYGPRGGMTGR